MSFQTEGQVEFECNFKNILYVPEFVDLFE